MSEYKNFTVKLQVDRHKDLLLIQDYYIKKTGIKLNQTQSLEKLLFEAGNVIRNTGDLNFDSVKK